MTLSDNVFRKFGLTTENHTKFIVYVPVVAVRCGTLLHPMLVKDIFASSCNNIKFIVYVPLVAVQCRTLLQPMLDVVWKSSVELIDYAGNVLAAFGKSMTPQEFAPRLHCFLRCYATCLTSLTSLTTNSVIASVHYDTPVVTHHRDYVQIFWPGSSNRDTSWNRCRTKNHEHFSQPIRRLVSNSVIIIVSRVVFRFDDDQFIVTTRYASLCWICHHSNSIRITNWAVLLQKTWHLTTSPNLTFVLKDDVESSAERKRRNRCLNEDLVAIMVNYGVVLLLGVVSLMSTTRENLTKGKRKGNRSKSSEHLRHGNSCILRRIIRSQLRSG
ncbi:uncharacterized protein LOC124327781 [Daphnia pulicaria]|uniref:uncharacterized protein LOC124327781 n=1 Tax=Daphnia pulicaria TaxID=35523 RepID=UPI001EEB2F08|nr:uncharacterized protein LOC124327781 [Daphnia pulicaria]